MIRYSKTWNGFFILFRWAGTAWPHGVGPGLVAAAISLILSNWKAADDTIRARESFISHPYAFQLFTYLLGVLMVFRTNFAYHRYMEAVGTVQAMGSKWLDGACMGVIFDAAGKTNTQLLYGSADEASKRAHEPTKGKGGPPHAVFASDLIHLCSLLHALALQHLRRDDDLNNITTEHDHNGCSVRGSITTRSSREAVVPSPKSLRARIGYATYDPKDVKLVYSTQHLPVLGGLSKSEREALEYTISGVPLTMEARVAMVEGWFMRRLLARQKFEQGESAKTSPPILSRLYQVISDGTLQFSHASKIALTPFPFPYHNLIGIFMWLYTLVVPVLVNGLNMEDALRAVVCFCVTFCYHALNQVGYNLEDPFMAYDPNELPLQEVQNRINMRLCAFCVTPQPSEREQNWVIDDEDDEDAVVIPKTASAGGSTVKQKVEEKRAEPSSAESPATPAAGNGPTAVPASSSERSRDLDPAKLGASNGPRTAPPAEQCVLPADLDLSDAVGRWTAEEQNVVPYVPSSADRHTVPGASNGPTGAPADNSEVIRELDLVDAVTRFMETTNKRGTSLRTRGGQSPKTVDRENNVKDTRTRECCG